MHGWGALGMTPFHFKIDWVCLSNSRSSDSVVGLCVKLHPGWVHIINLTGMRALEIACSGVSLGDTVEIKRGKSSPAKLNL